LKFLLIASYSESLINFRLKFIKALQAKNIQVHVAAPGLSFSSSTRKKLEREDVEVHDIFMDRAGTNPLNDIRTFLSLLFLIYRHKPDCVMAYTLKPIIYGIYASYLCRVKKRYSLITGLGYGFIESHELRRRLVGFFTKIFYKVVLSKSHVIFFQNPDDRNLFYEKLLITRKSRTFVVNGSGVDLKKFRQVRFNKGRMNFLLISRLLFDKGIREFVGAARKVKRKYPNIKFTLAGWIDENPNSISQNDLDAWIDEGIIDYLGKLSDVRGAIENCSVYVLPSYREGTPHSVLQAMSIGRPIITTDVAGCKETVVDGYNGFLVQVRSVDSLEEAMLKFIKKPDLINKMGEASRKIAEEKYDVDKVNESLIKRMSIG